MRIRIAFALSGMLAALGSAAEPPAGNPLLVPRKVLVPSSAPLWQADAAGRLVPAQAVAPPAILPAPKAAPADEPADDSRLPSLVGPVGTPPKPSAAMQARFDKFVDQVIDPQNTLDLVRDRTRLLVLKTAPKRVQMTDEKVATVNVVSPRELSLAGIRTGTTVLNLWFGDAADPDKQEVLSYLIRVFPDPEARDRLERVYDALAGEINKAFPDSVVKLQLVGDKLVVSGHAKDIADAFQILRVARANAPRGRGAEVIPVTQVNVTVPPGAVADGRDATGEVGVGLPNFQVAGGPNVINMLRVGGEHQVMLKVMVAEVNRAAARSVGVNFTVARKDGLVVFANTTGSLLGNSVSSGGGAAGMGGAIQAQTNLFALFGGGQVAAAINALRTLNLAKSLAEPTLTTLNGRPARFQSGGQFPVPVTTGFTSGGLQGVQFVPFGVSLNFTPIVTDDDRIRLSMNADVSTRDLSVAQTNVGGASVPSLSTRNFTTTVELRAGETLAVAGLVQNNFGSDANRVPFLGDMPYLGRLFAADRTSNSDQELVVLVTPYLVHPLAPGTSKPLPGDDLIPPTDLDFYLLGRLQSYGPPLDPAARKRAKDCERKLLVGPVGYTGGN